MDTETNLMATARYFGKCAAKGCKTRRVADGADQMTFKTAG